MTLCVYANSRATIQTHINTKRHNSWSTRAEQITRYLLDPNQVLLGVAICKDSYD